MKTTLLILSVLILFALESCGDASSNASKKKEQKLKEYSTSEVVVVNDTAYFNKDMSYFTGILIEEYVNDSLYSYESEYDESWLNRSIDSSGIYSMTTWVNGVKNGIEKKWYRNGQVMTSHNWKNNLLDGLSKRWYYNGNLCFESFYIPIHSSTYGPGTRDKFSRGYYENGQMRWDSRYENKKMHGKQTTWYENGQMESFDIIVNGKIDGKSEEWYKNGNLKSSKKYIMDKPNGIHKEWHENGQLKSIENYKDGLAIGAFKSFSEMGEVIGEVNLNNGNGIFIILNDNGQKAIEKKFENGLLKYEKEWYYNGKPKEETIFLNGERAMHKTWHENGFIEWNSDYINGLTEWSFGDDGNKTYESITVNRDSSARYNEISRSYSNGAVTDIGYFKFDGSEVEAPMDENTSNILYDSFNSKMKPQEKMTWLSDCKRGLRDVSSKMSKSQEDEYCNCVLDKMNLKYPDKNSEVDIGVSIDLGKECLIEILR